MKKRAVNWWSFTSTILLCLRAPFLWKTGTLGGGESGEGSGEGTGVGEASVSVEGMVGEGVTGVDMAPWGRERGEGGREKCLAAIRNKF